MRLAVVSPLPPAATGIADYTAELAALLASRHELELFHGQQPVDAARLPAGCEVRPAAELLARHARRPYDVVVHQLGNAPEHAFQYELVSRVPGLLVLHDLVLFHSRAAMFTDSEQVRAWRRAPDSRAAQEAARPWLESWREELVYCYPRQGRRLWAVHLGTIGDLLPYAYPLFRIPVEASRAVVVHSAHAAEAVRAEVPQALVLAVPQLATPMPVAAGAVGALRSRLGFAAGDLVVGAFGLVTREKRIDSIARAVARAARSDPRLRLLLVGPVGDGGLEQRLAALGLQGRCVVTGRLPFGELPAAIECCDLVVHLRWPTGRETSAALLRVMAQGRAVIVSDLQQQSEIPREAVRRVDVAHEEPSLEHELLALARDPAARRALGAAAAAHVRASHSPQAVLAAWEAALETARTAPGPSRRDWPRHWPRP